MTQPLKHDLFNAILKQGMTAHVDFNPQHPETLLPPGLRLEEKCKLSFDGVRCRDIQATFMGVSAGMTFYGSHYTVYVPWDAVFCVSFDSPTGPRGIVYSASLPGSVADQMVEAARAQAVQPSILSTLEPKQASLQGGAKIYNLAEERARRAAKRSPSAS